MLNRRVVVASAGACVVAGPALAQQPAPLLFPTGPLAANPIARSFRAVDLAPPDLALQSRDGERRWSDLKGKLHLVTLWAEWCAPCLLEAPDFAALQRRFGGPDFGIVAMLTASFKKLDLAGGEAALAKLGAQDLPMWAEPDGGMRLFRGLATTTRGASSLPCTLIVDAEGRIRGRAIGAIVLGVSGSGELSPEDKARLLARNPRTAWRSPAADAFVRGLMDGALA